MIQKISRWLLITALILTPVFFLPIGTDFFQLNKQLLFSLLTLMALIFWLIGNYLNKTVIVTSSPLLLPLAILMATNLGSALINSPKNPEAWLTRPALMMVIFIYFWLATTLFRGSQLVRKIIFWLSLSTLITALTGSFSATGALAGFNLPAYLTQAGFNLTGSPLNLFSFLLSFLPISLILAFKTKNGPKKLFYFLTAGVIISTIILVGYQLLPGKNLTPRLMPKLTGWSIAADTLKTKPWLGAGPNNFVSQFTRFKPISLNRTNYWAVNFSASANEFFHLLTTSGLMGFFGWLWLMGAWLKLVRRDPGTRTTATQMALNLATGIMFLIALFIPFSAFHWLILSGYLSLSVALNKSKNLSKTKNLIPPFDGIFLPLLVGLPLLAAVGFSSWQIGKIYLGEAYFQKSLQAANKNEAKETYNLQIKTIRQSPLIDRYRVAYSNTNLALAVAMTANPNLSDQDKQTITQLIQQAIREAKTAAQLNPQKAANWQNLAAVYRNLINLAEGADSFAIAAYNQAIQLDPANPNLRLDLGGLFYALAKYDEALSQFQIAVQLKPDYANAHYNLAHTFNQKGQFLEAYQAMQQVEALIPIGSTDTQKVQELLKELKAKLPTTLTNNKSATGSSELSEPSPAPTAPADFDLIEVE